MFQPRLFRILPMLRGEPDTPLFVGADFQPVQTFLAGAPRSVLAFQSDPFGTLFDYRDLQITCLTEANRLIVHQISIELWRSGKPEVGKRLPLKWGGGWGKIELDGFRPKLPLSDAKARLAALGLEASEYKLESLFETICRLVLPDAELHFFRGPIEPVLMEIHFNSRAEIERNRGDFVVPAVEAAP